MPTIAAPRLRELALTIVRAMGSREEEARDVADHLAGADLSGHDSHGIAMLPDYVRMLHAGLLVPNQQLRLVSDAGADPSGTFDDLGNAVRKIRVDLGIPIVKRDEDVTTLISFSLSRNF